MGCNTAHVLYQYSASVHMESQEPWAICASETFLMESLLLIL